MDNRITYTNWGKTYDLDLVRATYANNGNLAVIAFVAGTHERYGDITVNIEGLALIQTTCKVFLRSCSHLV